MFLQYLSHVWRMVAWNLNSVQMAPLEVAFTPMVIMKIVTLMEQEVLQPSLRFIMIDAVELKK